MKLLDIPKFYDINAYTRIIENILFEYSKYDEILGIYQIGSVSTQGISDLDFIFVFKDEVCFEKDLLNDLNASERYILKHNPFGICEHYWKKHFEFSLFSNYKLLFRQARFNYKLNFPVQTDEKILIQTALEYVLKLFISITTQYTLNVYKVRSLFLELKSLKIDLNILNNTNQEFNNSLTKLLELRENWFILKDNHSMFKKEISVFYVHFKNYIDNILLKFNFFLPKNDYIHFLKNTLFVNNEYVEVISKGFGKHLGFLNINSIRLFNLFNRFQKYEFRFPWKIYTNDDVLLKKYVFESEIISYNNKYLTHFLPMKSPFHITI